MSTHQHGEIVDGPHKGRRIYSELDFIELDEPNGDGKTLTRHQYMKLVFWRNGVPYNYCWTNQTPDTSAKG